MPEVMGLLTDDDLRQFATDGYLVVRNVVSESLLAAADAEIDEIFETFVLKATALRERAAGAPCGRRPRRADRLVRRPR
jgi:hypothetical protein